MENKLKKKMDPYYYSFLRNTLIIIFSIIMIFVTINVYKYFVYLQRLEKVYSVEIQKQIKDELRTTEKKCYFKEGELIKSYYVDKNSISELNNGSGLTTFEVIINNDKNLKEYMIIDHPNFVDNKTVQFSGYSPKLNKVLEEIRNRGNRACL